MASIILKYRDVAHSKYGLKPAHILKIGRSLDSDILIEHPSVSRYHARILHMDGCYIIEDMNSSNGVYINGKRNRIQRHMLSHGDHILIGKHAMEFLLDPDEIAQQPKLPDLHTEPHPDQKPDPEPLPPDPANKVLNREVLHAGELGIKKPKATILRVIKGNVDGRVFHLDGVKTRIGRSEEAEVRLRGLMTPKHVAIIKKGRKGFRLISVDQTWRYELTVNRNKVVNSMVLEDDDEIRIGNAFMFRFEVLVGD